MMSFTYSGFISAAIVNDITPIIHFVNATYHSSTNNLHLIYMYTCGVLESRFMEIDTLSSKLLLNQ